MELIQVGQNTYYLKNPTNIGIYKVNDKDIYLIDTANDSDAGRKILKIIAEQGWNIKGIINTHSNADHIGGNKIIQNRTNCQILAPDIENCFIENPILEGAFLYGSYPFKDLRNKFLMAKESKTSNIDNNLPEGLEYFSLKGHYFNMIGIKTSDDIYFLGDSLFSEETINKYHVFFIYNVEEYLNSLDFLSTLNGKLYIPSHCNASDDISALIKMNKEKITEICNKILNYCNEYQTFEQILKYIFDIYGLTMNSNQYILIGSTIKSYLSYLYDNSKISYEFKDNIMYWRTIC